MVNDAGAIALVDHRIKTLPRVGVVGLAYDGAVSTLELEQLLRHAKVERRDVVRLARQGAWLSDTPYVEGGSGHFLLPVGRVSLCIAITSAGVAPC